MRYRTHHDMLLQSLDLTKDEQLAVFASAVSIEDRVDAVNLLLEEMPELASLELLDTTVSVDWAMWEIMALRIKRDLHSTRMREDYKLNGRSAEQAKRRAKEQRRRNGRSEAVRAYEREWKRANREKCNGYKQKWREKKRALEQA